MIEKKFDVGNTPRFVATIASGSIDVVEGDAGVIDLQIESSRETEFEINQTGGSVTVRLPAALHVLGLRESTTRIRVAVPAGTTVRLSVASAEIRADVRLAEAFIDTASGNVSLSEVHDAKVKTASGDVAIVRALGEVGLRTASGDVRIDDAAEKLHVTTASGSVDVGLARRAVTSSTASGDLAIDRFEGSDLNLKSVSGNIRVGLPRGTKVALDARSLSGHIALPERVASGAAPDERRQVRAKLRTISGDIEIIRLG